MATSGDVADDERLERIRKFLLGESGHNAGNAFDGGIAMSLASERASYSAQEPFALLHALGEEC
jgi:hypothetical protein